MQGEIGVHRLPKGAGELTHKAAGLAEKVILRRLGRPRNDDGLHRPVVKKLAQNLAHQHRESGGGAQPRAGRKRAADDGVEAADIQAQLRKGGQHSAHQGLGRAELRRARREMVDAYAEGLQLRAGDLYGFAEIRLKLGADAAVNGGGQNAAVLMVGVIAGKLSPARRKERFKHGAPPNIFLQSIPHKALKVNRFRVFSSIWETKFKVRT